MVTLPQARHPLARFARRTGVVDSTVLHRKDSWDTGKVRHGQVGTLGGETPRSESRSINGLLPLRLRNDGNICILLLQVLQ